MGAYKHLPTESNSHCNWNAHSLKMLRPSEWRRWITSTAFSPLENRRGDLSAPFRWSEPPTGSTHERGFSDIWYCPIFQSDIRHWGWKLLGIRHSKISLTLYTLPLKGEKSHRATECKVDTQHSHFQVDTRHCQKFDLDTRHSDTPSWALQVVN